MDRGRAATLFKLWFLCPNLLCSTPVVSTCNLALPVIAPLLVLLTPTLSANDSALVVCTFESSSKAGKESEGLTKATYLCLEPTRCLDLFSYPSNVILGRVHFPE